MSEFDVKAAINSRLAEGRMKEVSDYVSRGRRLEHSPVEALAGAWINLIRAWAAAPEQGQDIRRVDIEAEYALRGLEPPYELVKSELERIFRAAEKNWAN